MPPDNAPAAPPAFSHPARNRYDRMEWAGAFGDLGTLVPFLVAYISVLRMDPMGILLAFGGCMVVCGLVYRTPIPVQPMKAIGAVATVQVAQTTTITPETVVAAALVTGAIWLLLGASGLATRIAQMVPPAVVRGVVLGLGLGFMLQGLTLMHTGWLVAAAGGGLTLLLLKSRRLPAMFALMAFGAAVGAYQQPGLWATLAGTGVDPRWPSFALPRLGWSDLVVGTLLLALPQVPLTLGNAVIAITQENNRLFPHAPVTERRVAISTGFMNLFSAAVGGLPQCHGAGGMAGHVAFGARTGGAVVILGVVLLVLAVFFSGAVEHLMRLLPQAVLGVILFITGWYLAAGGLPQRGQPGARAEALVTLATAGAALWNVAAAFALGLALWQLVRWRQRRSQA